MTPLSRFVVTASVAGFAALPVAAETILVTNMNPSGEGSFQSALELAGTSPEPSTIIVTLAEARLEVPDTLTYFSSSPLRIFGNAMIVTSSRNVTLFSATGMPELALTDITFSGPGGWSLENRGDLEGPAGKGIFIGVRPNMTGTMEVAFTNVLVNNTAGHGIHISDCSLGDDCDDGAGSEASIAIAFSNLLIFDVGHGRHDADGLRVDERGPGSIFLSGTDLFASDVGGDGVELDEGQDGNVRVNILNGFFDTNGSYCDPAVLQAFLPAVPEDDFDEGVRMPDAIPPEVTDAPDNACIERELSLYDGAGEDGSVEEYEFSIDVEDGFDIDEAGAGSIFATFSSGSMTYNLDEGFDFDEHGPGDIDAIFNDIYAAENADDAVKLSESGAGSVFVTATAMEVIANGGVGIVAEEEDAGDLTMILVSSATIGNDGGELGVEAEQDGDGTGAIYVIDSEIADGIETDGAAIDAD